MSKQLRQIMKAAAKRGWEIVKTNGGHFKWTHPDGAIMFTAQTPSDPRAIKNIESRIRRVESGLPVKG